MYIVHARLEGPPTGNDIPEARLLLMRSAAPEEGLEHVSVAYDEHGIDVTLFILKPTPAEAKAVASLICQRAAAALGEPGQWRVTSCG